MSTRALRLSASSSSWPGNLVVRFQDTPTWSNLERLPHLRSLNPFRPLLSPNSRLPASSTDLEASALASKPTPVPARLQNQPISTCHGGFAARCGRVQHTRPVWIAQIQAVICVALASRSPPPTPHPASQVGLQPSPGSVLL